MVATVLSVSENEVASICESDPRSVHKKANLALFLVVFLFFYYLLFFVSVGTKCEVRKSFL